MRHCQGPDDMLRRSSSMSLTRLSSDLSFSLSLSLTHFLSLSLSHIPVHSIYMLVSQKALTQLLLLAVQLSGSLFQLPLT
jgi:hypothetical protein